MVQRTGLIARDVVGVRMCCEMSGSAVRAGQIRRSVIVTGEYMASGHIPGSLPAVMAPEYAEEIQEDHAHRENRAGDENQADEVGADDTQREGGEDDGQVDSQEDEEDGAGTAHRRPPDLWPATSYRGATFTTGLKTTTEARSTEFSIDNLCVLRVSVVRSHWTERPQHDCMMLPADSGSLTSVRHRADSHRITGGLACRPPGWPGKTARQRRGNLP